MASAPFVGHRLKRLTDEEVSILESDREVVSAFRRDKLEKDAKKNWDLFYKRNSTHFFKDRHWITREFPELLQALEEVGTSQPVLLEAGCGVGNTLFPLLEENPNLFVYACDFSPVAIQLLQSDERYNATSCKAFQCDLTSDCLTANVPGNSVDMALLIFVLSAVAPEKMSSVITNISKVLRPGGLVFFRDYGLFDHAMLRFSKGHKLSENFYVRQDGTRAYYFREDQVADLFKEHSFKIHDSSYIQRQTVNRKENITAERIFIQGKFEKFCSMDTQ